MRTCHSCHEEVESEDYLGETEQCKGCHDAGTFEECGCSYCYEHHDGSFRGLDEDYGKD